MNDFDSALTAFKNGELIIVTDDADRENEGDLLLLAEKASTEKVTFMVRYTTGILCVALTADTARDLQLPLMAKENQDPKKTAFTISVDATAGMTTGVSAEERANTVRALADPKSTALDFIRPGHVFPLIAHPGGLTARGGHTEAGIELARLVGAREATLLSEIVNDDGTMARGAALVEFAREHHLPIISVAELLEHQLSGSGPDSESKPDPKPDLPVAHICDWAQLPLPSGPWEIATYSGYSGAGEHAVLRFGSPASSQIADVDAITPMPMVRIHSECFTGDVMHSQRCDCGEQLELAISLIQNHGFGYIIYLRDHEGRGIGLAEKIKAYILQEQGLDTVDANVQLGHAIDARNWSDATAIATSLGLDKIILLTNNPRKIEAMVGAGFDVDEHPLIVPPNTFNEKYVTTKQQRLGHSTSKKIGKDL
jgi:3,4-dihydroxy 2-butanone 4-phosphate synthase/GTP cyclohydrolase II